MNLNQKIAERRAELQQEHAAEEERKRQKALEQIRLRQEEEKQIQELAEKEASQKVQVIEALLQEPTEGIAHTEKSQVVLMQRGGDFSDEKQKRITEEAEKKVAAHIAKLANDRMTSSENRNFVLLLFGGLLGFFYAWWLGIGLLVAAGWYSSKVTGRHEENIKSELGRGV